MWVAHRIGLSTPRLSTHHEATIPQGSTLAQDICQINTLLDVVRDIHSLKAVRTALVVESLDLAIKAVPKLLQEDMHIGDVTRMLSDRGDSLEDIRHVGEVEVPTDGEALGSPVAAANHRMHVGQPTLPCRAIA